jgi:hypothetical protein
MNNNTFFKFRKEISAPITKDRALQNAEIFPLPKRIFSGLLIETSIVTSQATLLLSSGGVGENIFIMGKIYLKFKWIICLKMNSDGTAIPA